MNEISADFLNWQWLYPGGGRNCCSILIWVVFPLKIPFARGQLHICYRKSSLIQFVLYLCTSWYRNSLLRHLICNYAMSLWVYLLILYTLCVSGYMILHYAPEVDRSSWLQKVSQKYFSTQVRFSGYPVLLYLHVLYWKACIVYYVEVCIMLLMVRIWLAAFQPDLGLVSSLFISSEKIKILQFLISFDLSV